MVRTPERPNTQVLGETPYTTGVVACAVSASIFGIALGCNITTIGQDLSSDLPPSPMRVTLHIAMLLFNLFGVGLSLFRISRTTLRIDRKTTNA